MVRWQTTENTSVPAMIYDTGRNYEMVVDYDYSRGEIQDQWIHNSLNSGKALQDAHLPSDPQMDNGKTLPRVLHVIADGNLLTLIDSGLPLTTKAQQQKHHTMG